MKINSEFEDSSSTNRVSWVKPRAKCGFCSAVVGFKIPTWRFNWNVHLQMRLQFQHEQQSLQITTNKESQQVISARPNIRALLDVVPHLHDPYGQIYITGWNTHVWKFFLQQEFLNAYNLCNVNLRHGCSCMEINNARCCSRAKLLSSAQACSNDTVVGFQGVACASIFAVFTWHPIQTRDIVILYLF